MFFELFFKLLLYYGVYFIAIFLASLSIPTGAIIFIITYSAKSSSILELFLLIFLAFSAATLGDMYAYILGKKFKRTITSLLQRFTNNFQKEQKEAQSIFNKYGSYALFFSRFMAHAIAPILNYIAGFRKMEFNKFIIATMSGELVYAGVYSILGYIFKDSIKKIIIIIERFSSIIALLIIIILLLYIISKLIKLGNQLFKDSITRKV